MVRRADISLLDSLGGAVPALRPAAVALTRAGEYGAMWTAAGLVGAVADRDRRGPWLRVAAVAPVAIVANYAVKLVVRRERPQGRASLPAPTTPSFPSAHATSSFAAAVAIGRVRPGLMLPTLGLASAVALTRPYLGLHWPTDALAGAVLGAALGRLVPGLEHPPERPLPAPVVHTNGAGPSREAAQAIVAGDA